MPNRPANRNFNLPLRPLMEAMGLPGVSEFARAIGMTRFTVYRWLEIGITVWKADELAIKFAGLHPLNIWGSAFSSAGSEPERSPQESDQESDDFQMAA